ncbi:teichoic acid D-Ala incorporation-associated protein DltX [Clostridiaceae bacterium UIB06]|nr:teichoic acid D-Ala incorporation-associated protein DltX [Clostridiaceae bacterium UIB06]
MIVFYSSIMIALIFIFIYLTVTKVNFIYNEF